MSANKLPVRYLYFILIHHGILQRGIDALMAKELLDLFDGHALVNGHGCQGAPELVRMDFRYTQATPQLPQSDLHTADLQPVMRGLECDE